MERRKEKIRQARLERVIREFEEVVLPALAEEWKKRSENRRRPSPLIDEIKRKIRGDSN